MDSRNILKQATSTDQDVEIGDNVAYRQYLWQWYECVPAGQALEEKNQKKIAKKETKGTLHCPGVEPEPFAHSTSGNQMMEGEDPTAGPTMLVHSDHVTDR